LIFLKYTLCYTEQRLLLHLESPYFMQQNSGNSSESTKKITRDTKSLVSVGAASFNSLLVAPAALTVPYVQHQKINDDGFDISRRKVLLLPKLLDLCTLLAYVSGTFLSLKFEEEFWPEFTMIVRVVSADALSQYDRLKQYSGQKVNVDHQRYDISTKLAISALNCMYRLAKMKAAVGYMKTAALPLAWLTIPMLNSSMHEDVISLAEKTLLALISLNPTAIRAFISSLASLISPQENRTFNGIAPLKIWAAVITDPR
jgi:hypothetical protein